MTLRANSDPKSKGMNSKASSWFVVAIGVMVLFGHVFGKDMALRENARDAATHSAN